MGIAAKPALFAAGLLSGQQRLLVGQFARQRFAERQLTGLQLLRQIVAQGDDFRITGTGGEIQPCVSLHPILGQTQTDDLQGPQP